MPILKDGRFISDIYHDGKALKAIYQGTQLVWTPRVVVHVAFSPSDADAQGVKEYIIPAGIGRIRGLVVGKGGAVGAAGARGASVNTRRQVRRTRENCRTRTRRVPYSCQETYTDTCENHCSRTVPGQCRDVRTTCRRYSQTQNCETVSSTTNRCGCGRSIPCPAGYYTIYTRRYPNAFHCNRENTEICRFCKRDRTVCTPVRGPCSVWNTRRVCDPDRTERYDCPCQRTRTATCYRNEDYRDCDTEVYYETVGSIVQGGPGGPGGDGGHGFHETFDRPVSAGNVLEIRFLANGNVEVEYDSDWSHIAVRGGAGGAGGSGGRGSAAGSAGTTAPDVVDDDANRYLGGVGRAASGNRGGQGGTGASGVRISNQRGYQVLPGLLADPFRSVTAGTGYSAAGRTDFSQVGRGQTANNAATPGGVFIIGTAS